MQSNPPPPPATQLDRVKVVVRVRPPIPEELQSRTISEDNWCGARVTGRNSIALSRSAIYDDRDFYFDHILDQHANQDEAYDSVAASVVQDVLTGYDGTILAYGQTGSGKTFTTFGATSYWQRPVMTGGAEATREAGIVPRAICDIFNHIHTVTTSTTRSQFRVSVSFFEVYLETINDLLDENKANLPIREDPRTGVFVENLTSVAVTSPMQLLELIRDGVFMRATSSTRMNHTSSRSHVFLTVTVEQRHRDADDPSNVRLKRAVLTIVDLAGSERVAKSGSQGLRLEEAKVINKSLSTLGNCVASLAERSEKGLQRHVPIRDSKLTRLLRDTLEGNAKTCLVATISPAQHNYDETYSTMMFARRAMSVQNNAPCNEVYTATMDVTKLAAANKALDLENQRLREEVLLLQNKLSSSPVDSASSQSTTTTSCNRCASGGVGVGGAVEGSPEWREREEQLVSKFTAIIHHLQVEIAKLNMNVASTPAMASRPQQQQQQQQQQYASVATPLIHSSSSSSLFPPSSSKEYPLQSSTNFNITNNNNTYENQNYYNPNASNVNNSALLLSSSSKMSNNNNAGLRGDGDELDEVVEGLLANEAVRRRIQSRMMPVSLR